MSSADVRLGRDHLTTEMTCPWCHNHLNGALGVDTDERPALGDWTVCIECARVSEFALGPNLDLNLRKVPEKRWRSLPVPVPEVIDRMIRTIAISKATSPRKIRH